MTDKVAKLNFWQAIRTVVRGRTAKLDIKLLPNGRYVWNQQADMGYQEYVRAVRFLERQSLGRIVLRKVIGRLE